MPANKNALIRYKTIDNCLRNKYCRWTIDNLVDTCSDALYDMEGITKGVSLRTVQADLQIMRSDKLGYNAPIEVYDGKYYRYADPNYSIFDMPLSENDYEIMKEAVEMLKQLEDFDHFSEMADVVGRLQDKLSISKSNRKPIIHFDSVPNLKGLELLNPLYNYIAGKQTLRIIYQMDEHYIHEIRQMETQYFNPERAMFHYNHIYKKHNDRYIRDYGLPLKRFLYYLRGILVCKWLSQKATMPPVRFKELVDATVEEADMKAKIAHLLELKKKSNEHNLEPVDEQLFAWAQEWAEFYNQKVEQLHPEKKTSHDDKLNKLMYDTVNRIATEISNATSVLLLK